MLKEIGVQLSLVVPCLDEAEVLPLLKDRLREALGDVISPVIIGIVSDRYSMAHAFTLVGVMFVVAGIIWLSGIKFRKRDTELAATRLSARPANL